MFSTTYCSLKRLTYILSIAILLMAFPLRSNAVPKGYVLKPDSSNFITSSLIVVSPGENIYSALGHCAIRLECPMHDLDFCFSFGTNTATDADIFKFFAGQLEAGYIAIPTPLIMQDYQTEGREVKQVELNLTLHEQQRMWEMLDKDMVEGDYRKFNYLNNNCSSMSLYATEWSLINEQIQFNKWPEPMTWNNGRCARFHGRHRPWLNFINVTLMGCLTDEFTDQEQRISPEVIIDVLNNATIVPNDSTPERPVLKAAPVTLLPLKHKITTSPFTPMVVFAILLALVVAITLIEWTTKWKLPAKATDYLLFVAHIIASLLLLYMSTVACLFGMHWNWYLVVFNPIPAIAWLLWHKNKSYNNLYLVFTIVLIAFVAMTPMSEQLDMEHQLITLSLAVRCASNYLQGRKETKLR